MSQDTTTTLPFPDDAEAEREATPTAEQQDDCYPQLTAGCAQSVGMHREHNEDSLFTLTANLSGGKRRMPFGLYILADGMGGHQQGEVASDLAVRTVAEWILQSLYTRLFDPAAVIRDEALQELLREAIQKAHRAILKAAPGSGTTITVGLVLGDQLTIAHVGDSRAYWIGEPGGLEVLTRDHSLVRRLEELGQITAEEAAVHPQRNVLYRALGQGDPFEPDIQSFALRQARHLLLCSDGLWGVAPEAELIRIVMDEPDLVKACEAMVAAANAAGGPDNISVILVKIPQRDHAA